MTSPELLKTPLHAWHSENGGKMVPFGGWDMPVQYADGIMDLIVRILNQAGFVLNSKT